MKITPEQVDAPETVGTDSENLPKASILEDKETLIKTGIIVAVILFCLIGIYRMGSTPVEPETTTEVTEVSEPKETTSEAVTEAVTEGSSEATSEGATEASSTETPAVETSVEEEPAEEEEVETPPTTPM